MTIKSISRITVTVAATSLLWGCGGSSTSQGGSDSASEAVPTYESVRIIESRPVPFDSRSLEEMSSAISADTEFTPEDIARMIVMAESGIGHLQSMLDDLIRNDDAADTSAVMTELAERPWTAALVDVIVFLQRAPLDDSERVRARNLDKALSRAATTASQLEKTQLGARATGLVKTLTPQTDDR